MNRPAIMLSPSLRLLGLGLCGVLAACQRPTQLLPPAPIFEMHQPGSAPVEQGRDMFTPSLHDDDRAATIADFEGFGRISRIYFARNNADLSPEARGTLDQQAEWLRHHPEVRASVQGHADVLGTREHQLALGEKRAAAIKFYLASRGVAGDRLAIASFGKQRPVSLGRDEAGQAMNRRGETVLIGVPGASAK